MFFYKICWFYQDLKSENLFFLNLRSVCTARILGLSLQIMLSPPKGGTKDLYNSKGILEQVYFIFYKQNSSIFLRCARWL